MKVAFIFRWTKIFGWAALDNLRTFLPLRSFYLFFNENLEKIWQIEIK